MIKRLTAALAVVLASLALSGNSQAEERFIVLASTTSTENSGLYAHLLPIFTAKTGIEVRVVAKGTGQAIRMAERGDADVLLVHHTPSEENFVAAGYGLRRDNVMYNDYVLIGAADDPAGIKGSQDTREALGKIAIAEAPFLSRGDDSGTHKKEISLWQMTGVDVAAASGTWYRETGTGMGATLNTASAMNAYSITDRSTWLSFRNKGELTLLYEGDPPLFNQYGVILVNPKRHPHTKAADGQAFIDWLLSNEGQSAIDAYQLNAEQLFFSNAGAGS